MFGKQCVERMNKVGMLIDVSHCGQQTAYDAVMYSKKPIIMSHVGAKAYGTLSVWPAMISLKPSVPRAVWSVLNLPPTQPWSQNQDDP